jgi:glycosyltransferase involved in cell wall biosynthesis
MRRLTLSVVIPTFNRAGTLGRVLSSIVRQTVRPDEVIVVDDGSTDNTRGVLAWWKWTGTLPLKVVHQKNQGASAARNAGIASATGDLIAFIDSDDEYESAAIENLRDLFERRPHAIVAFGDACLMEREKFTTRSFLSMHLTKPGIDYEDSWPPRLIDPARLLLFGAFQCAFTCRKEALQAVGGYDRTLSCVNDRDLYLRLALEVPGDWIFTWHRLETKHYTEGSLSSRNNGRLHNETQVRVLEKLSRAPRFLTRDGKRILRQAVEQSARSALECAGRESPAQVIRTWRALPHFAKMPRLYFAGGTALAVGAARALRLAREKFQKQIRPASTAFGNTYASEERLSRKKWLDDAGFKQEVGAIGAFEMKQLKP